MTSPAVFYAIMEKILYTDNRLYDSWIRFTNVSVQVVVPTVHSSDTISSRGDLMIIDRTT